MKGFFLKIKNQVFNIPIFIIAISILIAGAIIFDPFGKFFIKRTFEKAFFYRTVGNCDVFVEYMAVNKDKWLKRCIKEKERDNTIPIKDFEVLRVNYIRPQKKAFLQVQLTREEKSYILNYEMIKTGTKWKITNEI